MQNNYSIHAFYFSDALHNLVPFLQFKKRENTHGGMLSLACTFTKSNTLPWVFFMFFKLYKWYQIAQSITFRVFKNNNKLLQFSNILSNLCVPNSHIKNRYFKT